PPLGLAPPGTARGLGRPPAGHARRLLRRPARLSPHRAAAGDGVVGGGHGLAWRVRPAARRGPHARLRRGERRARVLPAALSLAWVLGCDRRVLCRCRARRLAWWLAGAALMARDGAPSDVDVRRHRAGPGGTVRRHADPTLGGGGIPALPLRRHDPGGRAALPRPPAGRPTGGWPGAPPLAPGAHRRARGDRR